MLTSKSSKETDTTVSRPGDESRQSKFGRISGYVLVAAFAVVVVVGVFFWVKISEGVSRNLPSPAHQIRLQVVNSSGISGVGSLIASRLSGYTDNDLEIKVVDTADVNVTRVASSFVVARTSDDTGARVLATRLGLDPTTVVTRLLEHDDRLISATLVVGEDYGTIKLSKKIT